MPPARSGELSASVAILGLVIREPDTVAGVSRRLSDQFFAARFSRSVAHNTLPRLAQQGLVRVVEPGREPAFDRYEATVQGIKRFRAWLREAPASAPALRDTLHAKLALAQREDDLAVLSESLAEAIAHAQTQYDSAHARLRAVRRAAGEEPEWQRRLRNVLLLDEVTLWGLRLRRLERLRQNLAPLMGDAAGSPRTLHSSSSSATGPTSPDPPNPAFAPQ